MNINDIEIRLERKEDRSEAESLVRQGFWNVYRPGCPEHYVLHCMRDDPDFVPEFRRMGYGKSGFDYASKFGIRYHGLPEGADASFFICKELVEHYLDGVSGEYATPQCYFVDEAEAEEFDKAFHAKEKLKLKTQIF